MDFLKKLVPILFVPFFAKAQSYQPINSWRYIPVDAAYWEKIQAAKSKKETSTIFTLVEDKLKGGRPELEQAEAQYAEAQACFDMGFYYCAYDLTIGILKKHPGSMPAMGALFLLEDMVQKEVIIEDELQRLLNVGNFTEVPESLLPMVSYYVFKDNVRKNLKEWQKDSFKNITEGSYWKHRLNYYKILLLVQSGKSVQAEKALQEFENQVQKFPRFKESVRMQRARLLYELKEYKQAESIYASFVSDRRDLGKILLERAWLKFFQKDFSVALGMLETLKAPFFRSATHPEQYILSMVTYREICHYDEVVEIHKEFESVFRPWIDHLKENKPLIENKALLSMVLLQAQNMPLANMVGHLRQERDKMKSENFPGDFKRHLESIYEVGETRWKDYAKEHLNEDLKLAALEFLEFVEQAKLLEYVSGLDKFRMKARFENRAYKAPEADNYAIRKLFWPVAGEYWWDEMNSYQVLVSDRCSEGG